MSAVVLQVASFAAATLAAVAIYRLVDGGSAANASLTPLERAEKRLEAASIVAQSLFAISVLVKFSIRLGWLGPELKAALLAIAVPFVISVVIYLKARLDVMRAAMAKP